MVDLLVLQPVDYLVIGHLTQDITPQGLKLGGTAAYAAMTARSFGLRAGVLTACSQSLSFPELQGIHVLAECGRSTTTFENIPTPQGRRQRLHQIAAKLTPARLPAACRKTPIVHLGPVAQEVDAALLDSFSNAYIGLTLQGWLRAWDAGGMVRFAPWDADLRILSKASAVVLSLEDIAGDESYLEKLLETAPVLVITEGAAGARIFWNGDQRRFRPPQVYDGDSTGAGDIFAAAFFIYHHKTRDPWEAARIATQLAAHSVTRPGLRGVPTPNEVQNCLVEVIQE